jgi:hypothetical protein
MRSFKENLLYGMREELSQIRREIGYSQYCNQNNLPKNDDEIIEKAQLIIMLVKQIQFVEKEITNDTKVS